MATAIAVGAVALIAAGEGLVGCASKSATAGASSRSRAQQDATTRRDLAASSSTNSVAGSAASKGAANGQSPEPLNAEQLRERAIALLMGMAGSSVPEERANAVEALIASPGRLRLVAPEALRDTNPGVRGVAAVAVAKAELCSLNNDVRPLMNDPVPQVQASAILAMWRCRERVDPSVLAEMLKSDSPAVRAQAAYVLGEMKESSARQVLADSARDLIKRASPGAQRLLDLQIAEARIKLGDESAITDIRSAMFPARNEDLEAAALAAQIAGEVKDRWSINSLVYLSSVKDDEGRLMPPEVRLSAAGALAKMGVPQGAANAEAFLGAPSPAHRAQAVMVLGWSKQSKYLPNIAKMMEDPAPRVRIAASSAALQLTGAGGSR